MGKLKIYLHLLKINRRTVGIRKESIMAGDALTASTGLYLDELNKIRVLEPEIASETETLKDECSDFLKKTQTFKTIADSFVQHVDTLQSQVEKEKMKGIGYRNLLKSVSKQREAKVQQSQALIAEKKMQLERLRLQSESLQKVEAEQNEFIDQYIMRK